MRPRGLIPDEYRRVLFAPADKKCSVVVTYRIVALLLIEPIPRSALARLTSSNTIGSKLVTTQSI